MFGLFGRSRRRLPADLRPALSRDERIVGWAAASGDRLLVATTLGLWLPAGVAPPDGAPAAASPGGASAESVRLGWHEIHKASWSGRELAITASRVVQERDGWLVVADQPVLTFPLVDPGDLPYQVRARVTRSVGPSRHHPLPGGGGARVVARRIPGRDGLFWTVRYDSGVNDDDPAVRTVVAELVAQDQAGVGG